jgi:hypothetical protein
MSAFARTAVPVNAVASSRVAAIGDANLCDKKKLATQLSIK